MLSNNGELYYEMKENEMPPLEDVDNESIQALKN